MISEFYNFLTNIRGYLWPCGIGFDPWLGPDNVVRLMVACSVVFPGLSPPDSRVLLPLNFLFHLLFLHPVSVWRSIEIRIISFKRLWLNRPSLLAHEVPLWRIYAGTITDKFASQTLWSIGDNEWRKVVDRAQTLINYFCHRI